MNDPENVHLIVDEFRVRLAQKQIEERPLAERLKLVAMSVIEESQAVFGQRFAGVVEYRNCLATGLLVESAAVRYPGAAHILQPERLGVARDAFQVGAVTLVG